MHLNVCTCYLRKGLKVVNLLTESQSLITKHDFIRNVISRVLEVHMHSIEFRYDLSARGDNRLETMSTFVDQRTGVVETNHFDNRRK